MDAYVRPGDHRPHDMLGRLQPRNIFADPLTLARALPGIGNIFAGSIPESHLTEDGVRCVCGPETPVAYGPPIACYGECGRHFWRVGDEIRVANFEEAQ